MSLNEFGLVLYNTPFSTGIRSHLWLIPSVQTIHYLALTILVGSVLVADLRVAGVLATEEPAEKVVRRYQPWMWAALAVMTVTGLTLAIGEPNRVVHNWTFGLKMGLLLAAVILTLLFRAPLLNPSFQLEKASWASIAKPMAWVSLALWIAIIFCGRWIAYTN